MLKEWNDHLKQWETFLQARISSSDNNGDIQKYRRQLNVIENVKYAAVTNPNLLIDFINNTYLQELNENVDIHEFYQKLNHSQKNAVNKALNSKDLLLIQGPPGTGKTQVISEICLQLYKQNPKVRILICSETHIAVNNVLDRIHTQNKDIRIIRLRNKEESQDIDELTSTYIIETYKKWIKLNCNNSIVSNIICEHLNNPENPSIEKSLALSNNIVGMTCNRSGAYRFLQSYESFDYVIIDEVCKATLPEILMPLSIAKKAILVGDPKQLPPVFCSEDIEVLDLIEDCHLQDYMHINNLFEKSKETIFLDTQYRMEKQIGSFISEVFYAGLLKNGKEIMIDNSLTWIDYIPSTNWPITNESLDKPIIYNLDECSIIKELLLKICNSYSNKSIGIITPYKHQVFKIKETISSVDQSGNQIIIDTVDGFQGKECDIIIFSLTRTTGAYRFLADERRLNVALSRAKDQIYMIGNIKYANKNRLLKRILKYFSITCYENISSI